METNTSSTRPATTLRCGNIKATIWQSVSEKGPFFLFAAVQGSIRCLAQRHVVRSQRPGGADECRHRGEGVDNCSHAGALSALLGSSQPSGGFSSNHNGIQ